MYSCGLVQDALSQSDSFMKIILAALQEKTNITCEKQIMEDFVITIVEVMVRVQINNRHLKRHSVVNEKVTKTSQSYILQHLNHSLHCCQRVCPLLSFCASCRPRLLHHLRPAPSWMFSPPWVLCRF